jgi:hypothetical protein
MQLYVGDPWQLEVKATNSKTGAAVEPVSLSVMIEPPAARGENPTREPIGPIALPKVEENVYEGVILAELDEAGAWLAIVTSPAPFKKVIPVEQTVAVTE